MLKNKHIRFKPFMAVKVKSLHLTPFVITTLRMICFRKLVREALYIVLKGIIARYSLMARQVQVRPSQ